jgi:hypothetical protein
VNKTFSAHYSFDTITNYKWWWGGGGGAKWGPGRSLSGTVCNGHKMCYFFLQLPFEALIVLITVQQIIHGLVCKLMYSFN